MRSEDYKLCLALKLGGWKIWYEPKLKLKHYMPEERLDWMYSCLLLRGVGAFDIGLLPYFYAQNKNHQPSKKYWIRLLVKNLIGMVIKAHKLILMNFGSFEGDADVLKLERSLGFVWSLIRYNKKFDQRIMQITSSSWVRL